MSKKVRDNPNNRSSKPDLEAIREQNGDFEESFYPVPGLNRVEISEKENVKQYGRMAEISIDRWQVKKALVYDFNGIRQWVSVNKMMKSVFYIRRNPVEKIDIKSLNSVNKDNRITEDEQNLLFSLLDEMDENG